jgi:hypothetical protein
MTKINLGPQMEKELRAWQRAAIKDMQKAVATDSTGTPFPTADGWSNAGEMIKEIDEK